MKTMQPFHSIEDKKKNDKKKSATGVAGTNA